MQDHHVEKSAKLMQFKKQELQNSSVWMSIQLSRMCTSFFFAEKEKGAKIRVERPLERLDEATGLSLGSLCWRLYGVEKPKVQTQTQKVNDFIIHMFILSFIY